jgi:hypothetical protein
LKEIYREAKANPLKDIDPSNAGNGLKIDEETLMGDIAYLVDSSLLVHGNRTFGSPSWVRITHYGIDYIERKFGSKDGV